VLEKERNTLQRAIPEDNPGRFLRAALLDRQYCIAAQRFALVAFRTRQEPTGPSITS